MGCLWLSLRLTASERSDDSSWTQKGLSRKEMRTRLERYLQKNSHGGAEDLVLYDGPQVGLNCLASFTLSFGKIDSADLPEQKGKGLAGIKAALDLGRLRGVRPCSEGRYVDILPFFEQKEGVGFNGETRSFLAALRLKALEKAEEVFVMPTRDQVGEGACKKGCFQGIQTYVLK